MNLKETGCKSYSAVQGAVLWQAVRNTAMNLHFPLKRVILE
jgi:hypothetical protein